MILATKYTAHDVFQVLFQFYIKAFLPRYQQVQGGCSCRKKNKLIVSGFDKPTVLMHLAYSATVEDYLRLLNQDKGGTLMKQYITYLQYFKFTFIHLLFLIIPSISFGSDHGNSIHTATCIIPNSSTTGVINPAGDNDFFRIDLPSVGTLTVQTTGSTDTFGHLLDSNGQQISYNDDNGVGFNFRISLQLTAGTYYLRVRHWRPSGTGAYTLVSQFTDQNQNLPLSHRSFATVHASNMNLNGSFFHIVEFKKPNSHLSYLKTRLVPDNYSIIRRIIPLQINADTDQATSLLFRWLMFGSQLLTSELPVIGTVVTVITGAELFLDTTTYVNERWQNQPVVIENEMTLWRGNTKFMFLVETNTSTNLQIGATWQVTPNTTMISDFSLGYPHLRKPF